jgi:NAD(P)H dehydrogenase (quinone)
MADANILIAFYSRDGSTETLAKEVAAGAIEAGAEVRLRRARDLVSEEIMKKVPGWAENSKRMHAEYHAPTIEDAAWSDGIIFGTPTRFGNVSSELKAYIDSLGSIWAQGGLFNKAGAAFVSTASTHGGNEVTSLTLFAPMAHLGLIIVPNGYGDPISFAAGTPYGSSHVAGQGPLPLSDESKTVARMQGKRVTEVARVLKPLRKKS